MRQIKTHDRHTVYRIGAVPCVVQNVLNLFWDYNMTSDKNQRLIL